MSKTNSDRPVSISAPSLTFTTKVVGPLLKSKLLTGADTIALASTTRAMLISFNVQDAQHLALHLQVSSPQTVAKIEEYFTFQKFEVTSPKTTRRSILQRRFSEKSRVDRSLSPPKSGAEIRKRMTSWRFTHVTLKNSESAHAFLSMMSREASPATQTLKSTLQSVEIRSVALDFTLLAPFAKSVRTLVLTDVDGWPEDASHEKKKLAGVLPILRDLTIRTTPDSNLTLALKPNIIPMLFPKVEGIELSCATDQDLEIFSGLNDLKKLAVKDGARGDFVLTSSKIREISLQDQKSDNFQDVSNYMKVHFNDQKGMRTFSLKRAQFSEFIEVPSASGAVQHLDLSGCERFTSVAGVANFVNLVSLNLSGCSMLCELPDLSKISSLVQINLSKCTSLTSLQGLVACSNLQDLNLSHCEALEDSQFELLRGCNKLFKLNVSHCGLITTLENACSPSLRTLLAVKCTNLQTLPAKGESLSHMDCTGCVWIKSLAPMENLKNLKSFNIHGCGRVLSLSPLSKLKQLRELDCSFSTMDGFGDVVRGCSQLESLTSNAHESITALDIAPTVPELQDQPCVAPLRYIKLSAWKALVDISSLNNFAPTLEEVEITGSKIQTCEPFKNMSQLKVLRLGHSKKLTDISQLSSLSELTEIDLVECASIVSVEGLGKCPSLRWLKLNRCENLETLGSFENCPKLKRIEILGSERNVCMNTDSLRTLFMLEYKLRIAVLYSREEAMKWNEKDFPNFEAEFAAMLPRTPTTQELVDMTGTVRTAGGNGGCIIA